MAECMLRSSIDADINSKDAGDKDLPRIKQSCELLLSEVNVTHDLLCSTESPHRIDHTGSHLHNQMMNGQEIATDRLHASKECHLIENFDMELALKNGSNKRGFRKSQSALALPTLPVINDSSSSCSTESLDSSELKQQLQKLQEDLKRKEEECKNLTHVQLQTGQEVEELTASLFEEANKMVQDANIKRMTTERSLDEANDKIEVLQAEVTALKALVLTSTPSRPNPHLNPQIDKSKKTEFRGHRRSTSHHSFVKEIHPPRFNGKDESSMSEKPKPTEESESEMMKAFRLWRQLPSLDASSTFLAPIVQDDIMPCLNFANVELSKKVYDGIFNNTVSVEPMSSQKMDELQQCALSEVNATCLYCFKLGDHQTPFNISKMVRNRIISVCDFVTYVRYIMQGLVKSCDKEVFTEILQLRKKMCLARLGLEE